MPRLPASLSRRAEPAGEVIKRIHEVRTLRLQKKRKPVGLAYGLVASLPRQPQAPQTSLARLSPRLVSVLSDLLPTAPSGFALGALVFFCYTPPLNIYWVGWGGAQAFTRERITPSFSSASFLGFRFRQGYRLAVHTSAV